MARARNKTELLEFSKAEYEKLLNSVNGLSQDQIKEPVFGNRTVKDIVAHLYAWQNLFLDWYEKGMAGEKPHIPAAGYSWAQIPKLNEDLYKQYKGLAWDEALRLFERSHRKVMALVKTHTDEELTTKKKYPWTGSTNLASYLASSTSSHYVWANDLLKRFLKKATPKPAKSKSPARSAR